jgi:predicted GNAT family N-acyltransferase/diadenosine tetraphosphate (Ap4A) HIT family hydrolase
VGKPPAVGTALAADTTCPLCTGPGGHVVEQSEDWRVVRVDDQGLPGFHRLICSDHVREWHALTSAQRLDIAEALARWESSLMAQWQADKFNLASFGNVVPHLHWHLMPRWRTDPWWPQPIWGPRQDRTHRLLGPASTSLAIDDWSTLGTACGAVRQAVFVEEQGVAAEDEWDELDSVCRHLLIANAQNPLATGRLRSLGDGRARIGRMAVLREWRGKGLGRIALEALVEEARRLQFKEIILHAQTHALGFYAQRGFEIRGPAFDECGMPHREMTLQL